MIVIADRHLLGWYARYLDLLRDVYGGHCLLLAMLPDVIASASIEDLKDALRQRSEEVKRHLERLETVFEKLGERPTGSPSGGMAALLLAGSTEVLDQDGDPRARDAGLLAFAHRLAEYATCQYATLCQLARRLGDSEAAPLLASMLGEERQVIRVLTRIAMVHALADVAH